NRLKMTSRAHVATVIVALSLLSAAVVLPQSATGQDAAGLADLMVTTQMRHIKLWFAGKLSNWRLRTRPAGIQSEASRKPVFRRTRIGICPETGAVDKGCDRTPRRRRLRQGLYPADERVQFLPSRARPQLHYYSDPG